MARILITGGAKRIGKAIALHLAAAGYDLVLHYGASREAAVATADEAEALGADVILSHVDLCDQDATQTWLETLPEIQGVVHNASQYPESTLHDATYADFSRLMHLHAWTFIALTRHLCQQPHPLASIALLDTRITAADPQHFNYQFSKQATADAVRNLARVVAPVRVGGIAPGPVLPSTTAPANFQAGIDATVLGEQVSLHSVAEAVHYLLTASHTTGQILYVDGGRHLR